MNSLQKNIQLQCLDVQKEIEDLTMMVYILQMEDLDQFKKTLIGHLSCTELEQWELVVSVCHQ